MMQRKTSVFEIQRIAVIAAAIVCTFGLGPVLRAAESNEAKKSLEQAILPLIEAHEGEVGLAVKNLKSGESYEYKADRPMPTASLIKLPVMIATYDAIDKGKLSLDGMIELKKEDQVPGSGILTAHFSPGAKLSLRDAIQLMMVYSDNTATNLVLDKLGLPTTNEFMEQLGCPETRINSKVFKRETSIAKDRSNEFGLGSATARDMVKLCEQLHAKTMVSEKASQQMLDHLFACDDKLKVPRMLPPGTRIAHKTGSVSSSRTDAGIIESPAGPIAFCILTNKNKDQRWADDNDGDLLCANVGAAIYQYFNPQQEAAAAPVASTMQMGANGDMVVALQRTLNARLKPLPGIGTDGDFGPETESAVKKFQVQEKLEPTGIVNDKTWKALGPLVMEEEPVDEPAVVNGETLKPSPPDSLNGPPFVTCKAWAIIDGNSGEFLAGDHEDKKLEPASTTKMMTAYLVALLAQQDSKVLDEIVTLSERADKTPGSTSGIKAGEKLSVRELMYGMMLPSGNDATVAFAEHFGERLADDKDRAAHLNAYDSFVSAMNRKSAELGMQSTHFVNTHGMHSDGHETTTGDLAKLAYTLFQIPLIREVVKTPQHGYTLDSVSGYQRNIVWRNTNHLLRTEGYDGIKTGTTGAAGSCLVSTSERNGRRLMMVVLGSTSGDARYTDSRNLYRWAWKDLLKQQDDGAQTAADTSKAN